MVANLAALLSKKRHGRSLLLFAQGRSVAYSRSPAASRAFDRRLVPDVVVPPHWLHLNCAFVWLSEFSNWLSAFPTVTNCCETG
jgi:hypothetical protein